MSPNTVTSIIPPAWALFLDVDGTLLELAETPESVSVSEELKALLMKLSLRLDGAVAMISGRSIANLDELFAPLRLPAAGVHGCERRQATGCVIRPSFGAPQLDNVREEVREFVALHPGLIFEDKRFAIAVHYRLAPQFRAAVFNFLRELTRQLGQPFRLQAGKCVLEIRLGGCSKGTSIADYMREPPFRGRTPVFVGDDVTDEDGFEVVNKLGGISVKVGDASSTLAKHRLDTVAQVHAWLESLPPPLMARAVS